MIPVILSGGGGTRLWPLSRTKLPKQFCNIFEESLQTLTIKRTLPLGTPWILTAQSLRDLTEKCAVQLNLKNSKFLYEPQAKNTAPALAFLCRMMMLENKSSEVVGVFPSDQLIENEPEFIKAVQLAEKEAQNGCLVTLGIQPTSAHTGYGYIQTESKVKSTEKTLHSFAVKKFHEKPEKKIAEEFIRAGNYYWNAGIFIFRVDVLCKLFEKHQPEIWKTVLKLSPDLSNINEIYAQFKSISFDYAIVEKLNSEVLKCVPCDLGWSDVGSWDAVSELTPDNSNAALKIEVKSENNYLHSQPDKTYAFIGIKDLLVIDSADALLISKKGESQDVKEVVEKLKSLNPQILNEHLSEIRPWGTFEVLKVNEHFKSKIIHVNPMSQISYQSHLKREEHWLITQGHGEVILNEAVIPVQPGTYVKIPMGAKHRIKNTGQETIEFIEVQIGTYFGEDDIVRYKDDYNRA